METGHKSTDRQNARETEYFYRTMFVARCFVLHDVASETSFAETVASLLVGSDLEAG